MNENKPKTIYLDYSATTPLEKSVLKEMLPYFTIDFGNSSSIHSCGRKSAVALDTARRRVSEIMAVKPTEVYFTSGGSEGCNWAIKGTPLTKQRNKIVITSIEHAATISAAKQVVLEGSEYGAKLEFLPVDKFGIIDVDAAKKIIDDKTAIVAVMLVNNEVGTIQPVKEIARYAKQRGARVFCDAVQAMGHLEVRPKELGVDMLAISAHKFYGPKGAGVLYIRSGLLLNKLIGGGHQERNMRGGTSNVPLYVGLASALELALKTREKNAAKIKRLRDYLVKEVLKRIPNTKYNGHKTQRAPHNANFSFDFIEGESLLLRLDLAGVCASSGSACSSGSLTASHVLIAMGLAEEKAHGSIRFTFGKYTTKQEVDKVIEVLESSVKVLRSMSPLGNNNL